MGVAFSALDALPLPRRVPPELLRALLLVVLLLRAIPEKRYASLDCVRMFFDPTFKQEIAIREQAMAESIAKVRAVPGDVMTSNYVGYRSGKPYVFDKFNTEQRIARGALPCRRHPRAPRRTGLTKVDTDHRADWDYPLKAPGS